MNRDKIIKLFDNEKYKEVFNLTNPYEKEKILDYEVLYFLKSKIVLDNFKIKDKEEIKKLFFYYFYLLGKVEFENNYSFYFKKDLLKLDFNKLENQIKLLKNYHTYFELGKNEIFLYKIKRKFIIRKNKDIVDFFINFTYNCSELYAFSGDNFPLFKWLINELNSDKNL